MNSSNYVANKYSVYPVSAPLHPCEICFNDIEANRVAHHAINSTPTDTNWHSLHVECLQGWVDIREIRKEKRYPVLLVERSFYATIFQKLSLKVCLNPLQATSS